MRRTSPLRRHHARPRLILRRAHRAEDLAILRPPDPAQDGAAFAALWSGTERQSSGKRFSASNSANVPRMRSAEQGNSSRPRHSNALRNSNTSASRRRCTASRPVRGQADGQVDAADRRHADRAAGAVDHAHVVGQQVGDAVARYGVRMTTAEFHEILARAGSAARRMASAKARATSLSLSRNSSMHFINAAFRRPRAAPARRTAPVSGPPRRGRACSAHSRHGRSRSRRAPHRRPGPAGFPCHAGQVDDGHLAVAQFDHLCGNCQADRRSSPFANSHCPPRRAAPATPLIRGVRPAGAGSRAGPARLRLPGQASFRPPAPEWRKRCAAHRAPPGAPRPCRRWR